MNVINVFKSGGARRFISWRWLCLFAGVVLAAGSLLATGWFAPKIHVGRITSKTQWCSLDDVDHQAWDDLLRRYVDDGGFVNYSEWTTSATDLAVLDQYLAHLSQADPERVAGREARLAFWINAYNAVTIRGILREYPTASIQEHVSWLWGYNIWRDLLLQVGGKAYSLGEIEHQQLRPLGEPRIHFAIVCASRGCPRLLNRAYTAEDLDRQLEENSREFFADSTKFQYDPDTAQLHLSPILKWYADDFGSTQPERLQAIAPYLPEGMGARLTRQANLHVLYLDYDWSLNDQGILHATPPLPPDLAPVDDAEPSSL